MTFFGSAQGTALPTKASDQFIYIAPTSLDAETGASSLTSPGLFDDDTNEPTIANLWTSLLTSLDVTTQGDSSLPPKNGSVVFLVGLSELTYQGFSPNLIVKLWRGINSLAQVRHHVSFNLFSKVRRLLVLTANACRVILYAQSHLLSLTSTPLSSPIKQIYQRTN